MNTRPKPVKLTQVTEQNYPYDVEPEPLVVVGDIPGADITPQAAPAIDDTPADAEAVAADLATVVAALVAAGVFTA